MLISTYYKDCVIFLSQEDESGSHGPKGTAFIVADPSTIDGKVEVVHLVTARHVVEAARATGQPLFARGNSARGGIITSQLAYNNWHISQDTDIAIFKNAPLNGFVGSCIMLDTFAGQEYISTNNIGLGDEVFFTGLFTAHPGSTNNEPIIRFGNISMMPSEPVNIQNADHSTSSVKAFLVEARSWGGQSGSPAFVWLNPLRNLGSITLPAINPNEPLPLSAQPRLLGLVCGHFNISQDITSKSETVDWKVGINAGVAIVIPAIDIANELKKI
ncbi:hypothetical protein [Methyloglobulus sp.]|uniref:hypothetical protein n=1 Tax=Methyloglobulus sp. TaxID=2518622 RepID=UPI0032B7EFC4